MLQDTDMRTGWAETAACPAGHPCCPSLVLSHLNPWTGSHGVSPQWRIGGVSFSIVLPGPCAPSSTCCGASELPAPGVISSQEHPSPAAWSDVIRLILCQFDGALVDLCTCRLAQIESLPPGDCAAPHEDFHRGMRRQQTVSIRPRQATRHE